MPFIPYDEKTARLNPIAQPIEDPEVDSPAVLDTFKAAFKASNPIVSAVSSFGHGTYAVGTGDVDPEYDPFDDIEGTVYDNYSSRFELVNNRAEADIVKSAIDDEMETDRIVRQSGGLGILAAITSEVLNPVNWMPIGMSAGTVMKGGSILKGAATAGASGAAAETINETALQSSQETRTLGDSARNIGAATALTSIIGGGATAYIRRQNRLAEAAEGLEQDLTMPAQDKPEKDAELVEGMKQGTLFGDSVGAAKVFDTTLDQESLVKSYGVAKATAFLNPLLRVAHSPSIKARQAMQQLVESPVYFNKNAEGIATEQAVETLRKQHDAGLAAGLRGQRSQYKAYKKATGTNIIERTAGRIKGAPKVLNFMEFQEQVARAMRRNDTSDNPFVEKVAKTFRKEVFDPLKEIAVRLEMLPKDVTPETAASYLTRIWDKQKIIQHENEFRSIVDEWVRTTAQSSIRAFRKETADKIARLEAKLPKATTQTQRLKIETEIKDFNLERSTEERLVFDTDNNLDNYITDVTDNIVRTLKGWDGISPTWDIKVSERGPLKERTFSIPDAKVENFISNDMERIAGRYTKIMGTDVELQRKFGNLTMEDQLKEIDDEFTELSRVAETPKERKRIEKQRDQNRKDIESMLEIMRGIGRYTADPSNNWVRAGRLLRTMQYLSKMGQVVLSAFADTGRPIMVHGMGRVFGKALPNLVGQTKGFKMAVAEARKSGQVLETVLNGRMATLAEIGDPYAQGTAFERIIQNMGNTFSKVNISAQWNDIWKGVSSTLTMDRLIINVQSMSKGHKLLAKEKKYMAFLGIDAQIAKQMSRDIAKHAQKENGIWIPHTDKWENAGYARMFRAALNKDVDRTIVTKGIADVPLFVNSETGKLLTQFKTFALASHQRVLIAGLQQGDAAFVHGLIFSITAGMAAYALKETARGNKLSDDPNKWMVEGIDQSGVFTIMMEANNTMEKVNFPGLSRLAGSPPASRYASRNILGSFIGPTAGTIQDLGVSTAAVLGDDLKESDVRAMRRLLPYQNLWYTRRALDQAEKAISDSLGGK